MAAALGLPCSAYAEKAARLKNSVNAHFWSEEKQNYTYCAIPSAAATIRRVLARVLHCCSVLRTTKKRKKSLPTGTHEIRILLA